MILYCAISIHKEGAYDFILVQLVYIRKVCMILYCAISVHKEGVYDFILCN